MMYRRICLFGVFYLSAMLILAFLTFVFWITWQDENEYLLRDYFDDPFFDEMPVNIKVWFLGIDRKYSLTYLGLIDFVQALQLLPIFVLVVIVPVAALMVPIMLILFYITIFVVYISAKILELVLHYVYDEYEAVDYDDILGDPVEFVKVHTMVVYHVLRNGKKYFSAGPFILI